MEKVLEKENKKEIKVEEIQRSPLKEIKPTHIYDRLENSISSIKLGNKFSRKENNPKSSNSMGHSPMISNYVVNNFKENDSIDFSLNYIKPQKAESSISSINDSKFSFSKIEFDEAVPHFQKYNIEVLKPEEEALSEENTIEEPSVVKPRQMANNCLRYSMEFNHLKSHNTSEKIMFENSYKSTSNCKYFSQNTVNFSYTESEDSDAL